MALLSMPNNAILIVSTPVFNLLTQIQQDKLPLSTAVYSDFIQAFHVLDQLAQRYCISHEDLDLVKSCLARLVDDMMQCKQRLTRLSDEQVWPPAYLQLTLLGCEYAGVDFFEDIEKLLKNGKKNLYLIEFYHVCLALGLRGDKETEVPLSRLKVQVYQEIIRIRGSASRSLAPVFQQEPMVLTKPRRSVSLLTLLIAAVVLFCIGFFIIEHILRIEIVAHYEYVKEQAQLLIHVVSEGRQ